MLEVTLTHQIVGSLPTNYYAHTVITIQL